MTPRKRPPAKAKRKAALPLRKRLVIMGGSAAATLAVIVAAAALWGLWSWFGPGPAAREGDSTTVLLRQGGGITEIAQTLRSEHVIGSSAVFLVAAQVSGAAKRLKAGEYEFPSRASMATVIDKIRHGRVVRHFVTIPEGMTSEMAVDVLMKEDVLTGSAPVPPEGAILPETYEVQRGEDRAAVLQRMMNDRDALLEQLWAQRQPGLPFEHPEQAVVMASIVEKETAKPDERPRIAAVFINRLRQGMKLQSDPTIIYGLTRGRPLGRGIRQSELQSDTPYNTYVIVGLPPTPIANPGRASLAAVLDPAKTADLYFVADGTGGHAFSGTLDEHARNVARWRRIEQAREH